MSQPSSSLRPQSHTTTTHHPSLRHHHQSASLDHHFGLSSSTTTTDSDTQVPSSVASAVKYPRRRRPRYRRSAAHRRAGHYQVNPFPSEVNTNNHQFYSSHTSALPREPSTTSTSSSSTSTPSEASFDVPLDVPPNRAQLHLDLQQPEPEPEPEPVTANSDLESPIVPANCRRLKEPRNSSTFWDLITDVAKDLDLTLQDLSPDIEIFEDSLASSASSKPLIISAIRKHQPFASTTISSSSSHVGSSTQSDVCGHSAASPPSVTSPSTLYNAPSDHFHVTSHTESQSTLPNSSSRPASKTNSNSHKPTPSSSYPNSRHNPAPASTGDHHYDHHDHIDPKDSRFRSRMSGTSKSKNQTQNDNTQSQSRYRRSEQQSQSARLPGGSGLGERSNGSASQGRTVTGDLFKDNVQCVESLTTKFYISSSSSSSSSLISRPLHLEPTKEDTESFDLPTQSTGGCSLFERQLINQIQSNVKRGSSKGSSSSNSGNPNPSPSRIPIRIGSTTTATSAKNTKTKPMISSSKIVNLSTFGHSNSVEVTTSSSRTLEQFMEYSKNARNFEILKKSSIPRLNSAGSSSKKTSSNSNSNSSSNSSHKRDLNPKEQPNLQFTSFLTASPSSAFTTTKDVSNRDQPKTHRPAPPPPTIPAPQLPVVSASSSSNISTVTSGGPSSISLKRISTSSSSGSSSIAGTTPTSGGSHRHLEKLSEIEEFESTLNSEVKTSATFLPEGNVDEEDEEEEDSQEDSEPELPKNRTHSAEDLLPKIITKSTTKILTNGSSSEDLLEDSDDADDAQGSEAEGADLEDSAVPVPADKGPNFEERLKLAQPIWYLPHINRATVVHYLQGKNVGVFIIRQSSKPQTLALSVRLPHGRGPHVEHYLVEKRSTSKSSTLFRLEGSEHFFTSILNLVVYYSNCCDELPVRLGLPAVLRTSSSGRSQLGSLALLGQEFWQSKFVQLQKLPKNSLNTETLAMVKAEAESKPEAEVPESQKIQDSKPRLPPRRHPSSCSNTTEKSSSSAQSHSTASPIPAARKRVPNGTSPPLEVTRPLSPIIITGSSTKVNNNSTPPPLPPKANSPELTRILESPPKVITQNSQLETQPALPPRRGEAPPPIPPRTRPDSKEPTKISPPPRPSAGKRTSPQTVVKLNDLLSPMSMTESEIGEMVRGLAPAEPRLPSPAALAAAKANYYNHLATGFTSGPAVPTVPPPAPPSQPGFLAPVPGSPSPTSDLKTMCEVYTQTELPAKKLTPELQDSAPARPSSNLSSSTYYMDPIDALVVINGVRKSLALQEAAINSFQQKRHSDPELTSQKDLNQESTAFLGSNHNSLGQSLESLLESFRHRYPTASTAAGVSATKPEVAVPRKVPETPEVPPKPEESQGRVRLSIKPDAGFSTVDSAWQWHDCNRNSASGVCSSRNCPAQESVPNGTSFQNKRASIANSIRSDVTTVEDLISAQAPECVVPKVTHVESLIVPNGANGTGVYDNLTQEEIMQLKHLNGNSSFRSSRSDAATVFSEPWNMDMVESMILSEFGSAAAVVGSGGDEYEMEARDSVSLDATAQLLNTDLIHFNSYLLNQEDSFQDRNSQDYDNVADDEDYEEYHPMNSSYNSNHHHQSQIKRDDSEVTLKNCDVLNVSTTDQDPESNQNVMLAIVNHISTYVFELAARKDNTFAMSIDNFIECTKESTETNPSVILGYIRQFMTGMKNYLIKHGEGEFIAIVKAERSRLKSTQFLNIDSILECALQKLIIKPLKNFIYEICIRAYNADGSLKILSHNIKLAQNKSPEELGIRPELLPIEPKLMGEIQQNLRRLQQSYSPIKKLEHLLRCIALLNGSFKEKVKQSQSGSGSKKKLVPAFSRSFSGDDMLPLLLYIIVHCGVISIEIEIEYMLGLLHSSILNGGDGSYYLTVWSSAIQVLKNMYSMNDPQVKRQLEDVISTSSSVSELVSQSSGRWRVAGEKESPSASTKMQFANLQAYMKIMIPNELTSSIACKTVPVRLTMTTRDVCRMIAHTYRITNPEDYALYRIKDLEEIQLLDSEFPQIIKSDLAAKGELPMFAYKRVDAKFIWPTALTGSSP